MQKKRKKKNILHYLLIVIIFIIVFFIVLEICFHEEPDELKKSMKKDGYTTKDEDDAFYKRIVTNNTLNDYYKDIENKKDSSYEEYYLAKDSLEFISQKLLYQNKVTTSLNFSSNLKSQLVTFNYELSYKDIYLILEGNSNDEFECNKVVQENIDNQQTEQYCDMIQEELKTFLKRKNTMLNNPKVKELIQ